MESIINTFHIDWQIMIAQLVNFVIVIAVLWFFAFKPLNKAMEKRNKEIQTGLDEAKIATQRLEEADINKEEILKEARQESLVIVENANKTANSEREKSTMRAKEEVGKVVAEGREQLTADRQNLIKDIKAETAEFVALATEKILIKMGSEKIDKKLVEETIKEIK